MFLCNVSIFQWTTEGYIPEDSTLHSHHWENHKSHTVPILFFDIISRKQLNQWCIFFTTQNFRGSWHKWCYKLLKNCNTTTAAIRYISIVACRAILCNNCKLSKYTRAISRQQLRKHIPAANKQVPMAMNQHATTRELLEMVFPVVSDTLYNKRSAAFSFIHSFIHSFIQHSINPYMVSTNGYRNSQHD
jgi:hypothetical protein